jgi:hypothetical protein
LDKSVSLCLCCSKETMLNAHLSTSTQFLADWFNSIFLDLSCDVVWKKFDMMGWVDGNLTLCENRQEARMTEAEVVAVRLYTTFAYVYINDPLRDGDRCSRGDACPLPVTTYFAVEGIKKMRALNVGQRYGFDRETESSPDSSGLLSLSRFNLSTNT